MSDLIGRFLSFDERLGKGLVRFTYYVALFYAVVIHLYALAVHGWRLDIGMFLLVPFKFLIWVLILRVTAEVLIAILSIEENQQPPVTGSEGFEAGLTPSPVPPQDPSPSAAPAEPEDPDADEDDGPEESLEDNPSATETDETKPSA